MNELPETPLEPFIDSPPGGPTILFKREDRLPFGGGNKVRRFLTWLDERGGGPRSAAAFSDAGSHTFAVLTRMLEAGTCGIERLLFWERARPNTPYVERVRRMYAKHPRIEVVRGPTWLLTLKRLFCKTFRRSNWNVMGIGGAVTTHTLVYEPVLNELVRQLDAAGFAGRRVWHLLPIASGNTAEGLRRVWRERGWTNHRMLGVLTGPRFTRWFVRRRFNRSDDVTLVSAPAVSYDDYVAEAETFLRRTGIRLDPVHTIHTARLLRNLPPCVTPDDVVVYWVTCPALS